jgi:hypothetical protein
MAIVLAGIGRVPTFLDQRREDHCWSMLDVVTFGPCLDAPGSQKNISTFYSIHCKEWGQRVIARVGMGRIG